MWTKEKTWRRRQRKLKVFGRVYPVSPRTMEKYCLRMLLLTVPGPTSWEALRTLEDGTVCDTFRGACMARGMLTDDKEWNDCLSDAAKIRTGRSLRHLFITVLVTCTPSDPLALWTSHKESLCEDILHRHRQRVEDPAMVDEDRVENECLQELAEFLLPFHNNTIKSLADPFGLPTPRY